MMEQRLRVIFTISILVIALTSRVYGLPMNIELIDFENKEDWDLVILRTPSVGTNPPNTKIGVDYSEKINQNTDNAVDNVKANTNMNLAEGNPESKQTANPEKPKSEDVKAYDQESKPTSLFAQMKIGNTISHTDDVTSELRSAVLHGNVEEVKKLIAASADMKALIDENATVIFSAIDSGSKEMVELLISLGADIRKVQNSIGWSPLQYAVKSGKKELAHFILGKIQEQMSLKN